MFFDLSKNPQDLVPNIDVYLLVFANNIEVVHTQEGGNDKNIFIHYIGVFQHYNEDDEPTGKFSIELIPVTATTIYFKVNKLLKVRYLDPIIYHELD